MTDETPPTPAPVAAPVPAAPVVKPPSLQISNYLGGIVAVVGNALPALTPDFLASLGFSAFWVHIFSSVIATALFVYQEKVPAAKAVPAPKQSGQAHVALLWVLAAVSIVGVAGCSYLSAVLAPAAQPFVLAAVDVAVAQAVTKEAAGNAAQEKIVAAKIKSVASQVLAADNSVTTTVATLEIDLNAKIVALKLPPPELAAGLTLAASIEAALTTYISTTPKGQVVATTQLAIADICNAVITAAGAYGV